MLITKCTSRWNLVITSKMNATSLSCAIRIAEVVSRRRMPGTAWANRPISNGYSFLYVECSRIRWSETFKTRRTMVWRRNVTSHVPSSYPIQSLLFPTKKTIHCRFIHWARCLLLLGKMWSTEIWLQTHWMECDGSVAWMANEWLNSDRECFSNMLIQWASLDVCRRWKTSLMGDPPCHC